jgi:hypothetical protein
MFSERWLRHVDRLPSDVRRREQIFDWVAIFFTIVGSAGLILLSIVSLRLSAAYPLSDRPPSLTRSTTPPFIGV